MAFIERFKRGWNAFQAEKEEQEKHVESPSYAFNRIGISSSYSPYHTRPGRYTEKSILDSIITRIAMDVASLDFRHVRLDKNGSFEEEIDSGLDRCLNVEANIDQTALHFKQDIAQSLCEEGVIAIVAVDTTVDPNNTESYDIDTMRVGIVKEWYPRHVRVELYNDRTGKTEEIQLHKKLVAIIENPLYTVMNSRNSTLQRLDRKIQMLDAVDEQSSSGKLDLIFQLPYTVKTETRRRQAAERREDIERQLRGSQYGIAYVDATERITQLNRPAENNLLKQVEYLTQQLYSQLGMTPAVFDGTADELQMLNYHNRTIGPLASAICEAMHRTFLSKTAQSQNQAVRVFRDPFKSVPISDIAEIADKFTRNEILSSNEIRSKIGFRPSSSPKADELRNSNLNHPPDPSDKEKPETSKEEPVQAEGEEKEE